jgi:uncharacterized protein YecE (DUF72 family)
MRVKTGVTSWAERTLITSGWYPPSAHTAEARLRFYASQFPIVETDMPYYALPEPALTEAWAARTPPGFTMNVKAHALLTGHYTDPRRLPPDLREALPAELVARERVYARQLDPRIVDEVAHRFREAMIPLAMRGRLGVLLFQYPVWFVKSHDNLDTLARLGDEYAPHRVAVEFRNASWMREEDCADTLGFLKAHHLSYVCVDEPQGTPMSVPPIVAATAEVAVVRMHGRNLRRWQRGAETAADRFEHLYTVDELRQWVPRVAFLAARAPEVHLLFNNCHQDYAARNARQMTELLTEGLQPAPEAPAEL